MNHVWGESCSHFVHIVNQINLPFELLEPYTNPRQEQQRLPKLTLFPACPDENGLLGSRLSPYSLIIPLPARWAGSLSHRSQPGRMLSERNGNAPSSSHARVFRRLKGSSRLQSCPRAGVELYPQRSLLYPLI